MSKVLLPTPDYAPAIGGVARYLTSVKNTLKDDVHILHVQPLPRGLALYNRILQEVRNINAESILTSHLFPIGTMALLLNYTHRIPYGIIVHGLDFDLARRSPARRFLANQILRHATYRIANSNALAREVTAFCGKPTQTIYPVAQKAFYNAELPIRGTNSKTVNLITVARLVKRKGHTAVLHALQELPQCRYMIVGDGEGREMLETLTQKLGLASRVEFYGAVSDERLMELYKEADIFVMPTEKSSTDREGFGIVYLEAQLMGLPVIAVNHAGVNEAVVNGEGGILLNEAESELVPAIKQLAQDAELRNELGKRGRERVLREFNEAEQFGKLKTLI